MIRPLALPKAVNGVPALMAAAGVPLLPLKLVRAHPLKQLPHQCSTGQTLKQSAKNILANGAPAPAVTLTAPALATWPI